MSDTIAMLYDATPADLEGLMRDWGQPAFRARQLYRHLYVNLADNASGMTDLPLTLRQRLAAETQFGNLRLVRVQTADNGLTRKALFALPGSAPGANQGNAVLETVLMVYPERATVCVSTQAGCAMGCVFCATGKLGLLRNLSSGEIVEQVLWAARELRQVDNRQPVVSNPQQAVDAQWWSDESNDQPSASRSGLPKPPEVPRITNVVFMGMGEPFANYDRWWAAVERLHDPQGFNLGARSMTVSTVGLAQGIRRLASERLPINLAISLHASDDELRSALMPINRRYPIADLLDATRYYIKRTNRRVSFEYVLLQGRNDDPQQALALAKLLRGELGMHPGLPLHLCHVNLIPWNPVPGTPLGRSERKRVLAFQQILLAHGVVCTVRVERGVEIAAACGQLAGNQLAIQNSQLTIHTS